jgi:hypothetical protein
VYILHSDNALRSIRHGHPAFNDMNNSTHENIGILPVSFFAGVSRSVWKESMRGERLGFYSRCVQCSKVCVHDRQRNCSTQHELNLLLNNLNLPTEEGTCLMRFTFFFFAGS